MERVNYIQFIGRIFVDNCAGYRPILMVLFVLAKKQNLKTMENDRMKRELLDNGNIWRKSDGRWIGMVRYKDEFGEMKRKSFSSKKKKDLQEKMTDFVINFQEQLINSDETRKPLRESMKKWLQVYKYPEIEHTTYDRYECTAENQIYPYIGDKPVEDITSADIKKLMTN